jgi:hypothetical protein
MPFLLHFLSMCVSQTKIQQFETNDNVLIIRIWFELHTSEICMMEKILLHDNINVYTKMILLVIYHVKVQNLHDDKNINICCMSNHWHLGSQINTERIFNIAKVLTSLWRCKLVVENLNKLVLILKNYPNDIRLSCV